MEKMLLSVEWEGWGPLGPKEVKDILEAHFKKTHFIVHRLNVEAPQREKLTYSVSEAASLLGISTSKLYSLLHQKQVPGIQYGKRWLIPKIALERQLGATIVDRQNGPMSDVERADLIATMDEALKLYDLLRARLTALKKNLSDNKTQG